MHHIYRTNPTILELLWFVSPVKTVPKNLLMGLQVIQTLNAVQYMHTLNLESQPGEPKGVVHGNIKGVGQSYPRPNFVDETYRVISYLTTILMSSSAMWDWGGSCENRIQLCRLSLVGGAQRPKGNLPRPGAIFGHGRALQ
jgi:hypothetical protein